MLATVWLTDIAGSTEQAAELGDRRWRDLLEEHHALVRRELKRYRWLEIKTTGDGFLATFDGPARAIRCARSVCGAARSSLGIEIRAGLHTGECELIGEDVGGIAVHVASRVAAIAKPAEILVTNTTRDLVAGSGIEFKARGSHALKGISGRRHLYSVVSA